MTNRPESAGTPVLRTSRTFRAPAPLVFSAWTCAAHLRQWFCPLGFSIPAAQVDAREGGVFAYCMRADADGAEHWVRGVIRRLEPGRRLDIEMRVEADADRPLFIAHTRVEFTAVPEGTRVDVEQTYELLDAAMAAMLGGAPEGWRQSLDRLESLLPRLGTMHQAVHDTFHLERTLAAAPAAVWRAFTEAEAKSRWFTGTAGQWTLLERHLEVRPGGSERLRGRWANGLVTDFRCSYHDVVAPHRLVYSYEMYLDERKISVSLATVELHPEGAGTCLRITEQGTFLDGYVDGGSRQRGTAELLERMAASLG